MLSVDGLGHRNGFLIPASITSFVAAQNEVPDASGIEDEQDTDRSTFVLNAQFLQVGNARSLQSVNLRPG
jgi:hypothetical protein